MPEQYFSQTPTSPSAPAEIAVEYRGRTLAFTTDAGVFSRGGLDAGTRLLLRTLPQDLSGRVLDLGCGWGAAGVCVGAVYPQARVTFCDINERAVALTRANAQRNNVAGVFIRGDGLVSLDGRYDIILLNPPIRAGKQVVYGLFSQCAARLESGGSVYIVMRKRQGAPSAVTYLSEIFTEVSVIERSGGYRVIRCAGGKTNAV